MKKLILFWGITVVILYGCNESSEKGLGTVLKNVNAHGTQPRLEREFKYYIKSNLGPKDILDIAESINNILNGSFSSKHLIFSSHVPKLRNNRFKLYFNEFLASNVTSNVDRDFGAFSDWIELYNAGDKAIDIGCYYLTNDLKDSTKWQIPDSTFLEPGGFKLFWADGKDKIPNDTIEMIKYDFDLRSRCEIILKNFHLNFRLNKNGGEIGLFNPDRKKIDVVSYKKQISDVSSGRKPDGIGTWYYFGDLTPGAINNTDETIDKTMIAPQPQFSIVAGFYTRNQQLLLSSEFPTAVIRYTVDGSMPNSLSNKYISPIMLDSTKVIRARTFTKGYLPSETVTHTYFVDEKISLPVISLSINPDFLWDDQIGIYILGENGVADLKGRIANYNQNWERPTNIEFFDINKKCAFNHNVGIKVIGVLNQILPQKSIAVYARKRYGIEKINYKLFNDKNIEIFKNFILRNSGADWHYTMFRDGLMQSLLIDQMDVDYQAYRPVLVFINGNYWGIQNLREKLNEHYPETNHGADPDKIDLMETLRKLHLDEGDSKHYDKLINFIEKNDMAFHKNYDYLKTQMDVNEFINYQIAEIYFANHDWPANNSKFWRPKTKNGKWRWIIVDVEYGFGLAGKYDFNTLDHASKSDGKKWNKPWSTLLFRKLLQSQEFKNEFIQRFACYLNTTFHPARVIQIIDSLKTILEPEMQRHINRWHFIKYRSLEEWEYNIETMRIFARKRPVYIRQHIINHFNLSDTSLFAINTVEYSNIEPKGKRSLFVKKDFIESYQKSNAVEIDLPDITNNVQYAIGKYAEDDNRVQIIGWAYINGYDSKNTTIFICLKSAQNKHLFSTVPIKRKDVTAAKNTLNFDDSGFAALIYKDVLEPGIYNVGVCIVKNDKISGRKYINRKVKIVN